MNDLVEIFTYSLVKDYLEQQGLTDCLKKLEQDKPVRNVANRSTLTKTLKIKTLMTMNKERERPLPTIAEVVVDYLYKTHYGPDDLKRKLGRTGYTFGDANSPGASPSPRAGVSPSPPPQARSQSAVPPSTQKKTHMSHMNRSRPHTQTPSPQSSPEPKPKPRAKKATDYRASSSPPVRNNSGLHGRANFIGSGAGHHSGGMMSNKRQSPANLEKFGAHSDVKLSSSADATVSERRARTKPRKPILLEKMNKRSDVDMRSDAVDQHLNVMEMKMKSFKSDLIRLKDLNEERVTKEKRSKKNAARPAPDEKIIEEKPVPGAARSKKPCGLCGHPFSLANLPGMVTFKAVCDLREKWCVNDKIHIGGKGRFPTYYDEVRLCRFCFQFFDVPDYYRPTAAISPAPVLTAESESDSEG
eukprot:GFYU01010090.1.p1 GENE.GFYU01010090.1~~GFYU01010090.1.p1  ORF type:complete len:414 (-),score=108.76 GFYU01010090.1:98-1339(-)